MLPALIPRGMQAEEAATVRARLALFTTVILLSSVLMLEVPDAAGVLPLPQAEARRWLGPDGAVLPFTTDEEALAFLRDAEILSTEDIPVGVTNPEEALLEHDGVRAKAVYKDIDVTYERTRMSNGEHFMNLRDYYVFEVAAYEMSLMLGLDNVPPTVLRTVRRDGFSLQLWIHNGMTEKTRSEEGLRDPNRMAWTQQVQTMYLFDDLIGNVDRNAGDIVIDRETWKLWMIDHSRAFQIDERLRYVDRILYCDSVVWERLATLDEQVLKSRLGEYLTPSAIRKVLERRDGLVAHIQALIDLKGPGAVLFSR